MSESIREESPMVERNRPERRHGGPAEPGVTLRERPGLAYINLRGDPAESAFIDAVRGVTGLDLPTEPNTFVDNDEFRALWLGPDEWYVVAAPGREIEVIDALEQALAGQHFATNDVTSGLATVQLWGPRLLDVLAKGCTLDLHPRVFGAGQCAQTLISHAGVVLRHVDTTPCFEITVRRSFADFLWLWLEDAALEYGMAVAES